MFSASGRDPKGLIRSYTQLIPRKNGVGPAPRTRSIAHPFAASVDTLGSLFVERTSPLVAAAFERKLKTLAPRVSEGREAARRERGQQRHEHK